MTTEQREENCQSKKADKQVLPLAEDKIWACTWTVWMRIATVATDAMAAMAAIDSLPKDNDCRRREYPQPQHQSLQHKQQFLTALLQIFPLIFTRIKTK